VFVLYVVTDEWSSVFEHTEAQNLTLKSTQSVKNCNHSVTSEQNAVLTLGALITEAHAVESHIMFLSFNVSFDIDF
jgi:hypothetical protein